jgi:Ras-related protein Rab-5C
MLIWRNKLLMYLYFSLPQEAQKYAQEEGLMWGETSAKSGDGVAEIFGSIGKTRLTLLQCTLTEHCSLARKLPLSAPPPASARASAPGAKRGVDLSNKNAGASGSGEACNC